MLIFMSGFRRSPGPRGFQGVGYPGRNRYCPNIWLITLTEPSDNTSLPAFITS